MKKHSRRPLNVKPETIRPLELPQLADVVGGSVSICSQRTITIAGYPSATVIGSGYTYVRC